MASCSATRSLKLLKLVKKSFLVFPAGRNCSAHLLRTKVLAIKFDYERKIDRSVFGEEALVVASCET